MFARPPLPGRAKTRLGTGGAALAGAFLEDSLGLAVRAGAPVTLWLAEPWDGARFPGVRVRVQPPGTLGERLAFAMREERRRGAAAVAVMGSDSPTLPVGHLVEAFAALERADVVFGPTSDGGYWLVGTTVEAPELFGDIPWSTPAVLRESLRRALAAGRRIEVLPWWYDVDEPADLELLSAHLGALDGTVAPATRALLGLAPSPPRSLRCPE